MHFPDPSIVSQAQPDLLSLDPVKGTPPKTRICDAVSAFQIHTKIREADVESAWARKNVQEMFDGEPPLNQRKLKSDGQGHRFNLNFGEAAARKEAAVSAYHDMLHSVDTLCTFRSKIKDPTEGVDKMQIVAEEYHWLVMNWNQFDFRFQLLTDQFVAHGVGITYFEDEYDWRFMVSGLGDFLFPRGTNATEEDVEVATAVRRYPAHKLYHYIEDEASAEKAGWNVEAVKEAILQSAHGKDYGTANRLRQWEEFQREMKNNDLTVGFAKTADVRTVHIWAREFNEKVSHYIIDDKGQIKDFLFKGDNRFDGIDQCFTVFTYGVGNGSIHSIRGQGYKMFNHIQASNRLGNMALDAAFLEMSLIVQAEDAEDLNTLGLVNFGPVTALPPGLKIQEHQFRNRSAEALPLINHLSMQIDNNTGSYRARGVDPSGQERTKFEVQAQLQHEGSLSSAAMALFYVPWKRLHSEIFRRVVHCKAGKGGYKEAAAFKKRCLERGVTQQDLESIFEVVPTKAVGAGSAQMRLLAFDELLQIAGALDEVGRNRLLRDKISSRVGSSQVDRYLPKIETSTGRPPVDAKIAMLENSAMEQGEEFPVTMGEAHFVHATVHMGELQRQVEGVNMGQIDPQKAVGFFQAVVPHIDQTLRALAEDSTRAEQIKQMQKAFSQLANAARRISQKVMEAMQAEQEAMAQQAQQAGDPEMMAKAQEHQMKLAQNQEKHEQKLALRSDDVMQKMQLRDLQTAQKLRSEGVKQQLQPAA